MLNQHIQFWNMYRANSLFSISPHISCINRWSGELPSSSREKNSTKTTGQLFFSSRKFSDWLSSTMCQLKAYFCLFLGSFLYRCTLTSNCMHGTQNACRLAGLQMEETVKDVDCFDMREMGGVGEEMERDSLDLPCLLLSATSPSSICSSWPCSSSTSSSCACLWLLCWRSAPISLLLWLYLE